MTDRRVLDDPEEGWLTRFSLDRRVTVLVLFVTLLVIGAVAAWRIPAELIPRGFDNEFLRVQVPWGDAPGEEVLEKITEPLEDELATLKGIDRISSWSGPGGGHVFLFFKSGTDMDIAYREVRDRVERARRVLPADVEKVYIHKFDPADVPVMVLGVAIDPALGDTYDLIDREIITRLERVDGVANVGVDGMEPKEILIELDRAAVASAGLDIYSLSQQLGDDNFTLASGQVRDGPRKLLLRSIARYADVDALRARVVAPGVRLGDIATIRYDEPDKDYEARAMSKPAVAIFARKEGDANTAEVCRRLEAAVGEIEANPRLAGLDMVILFDQGKVIRSQLRTLLNNGLVGGLIAAGVLFLFLRRTRMTLIVALSIPVSVVIGLTVMYFSGETLNVLTLLGLMISIGLLVDNSVVVAENIHRMRRDGLPLRRACVEGAGEIALAITLSTLTTVVVFASLLLIEGQIRFFLLRLAIPVSVSLLGSLVVALVFVPLSMYLTLSERDGHETSRRWIDRPYRAVKAILRGIYEATVGRVQRIYLRLLRLALGARLAMVLVLVAVCGVVFGPLRARVDVVDQQEDERAGFHLNVRMPEGTTFDESRAWFLEAERIVESHRDPWGLEGWFVLITENYGEIQGWFSEDRDRGAPTAKEIVKELGELLPEKPGLRLLIAGERQGDDARGEEVYSVSLVGEDARRLDEVAEKLEDVFVRVPGVVGIRSNADRVPSEIGLVLDRERAQAVGANPQVVAGVVGYALRGAVLPRFHRDGVDVPVRIRFAESDRESLDQLEDFLVPTAAGGFLPVGALTDVTRRAADRGIFRRDKQVMRSITLELDPDDAAATRARLAALQSRIGLPEGVGFGADRSRDRIDDETAQVQTAIWLAVVFMYLLMAFLFESLLLPLSIIVTIPLSFLGVILGHVLSGRDIDFLGFVGVVVLIGVVVNNGIVLIDYVNRLRRDGLSQRDAVLTAVERRFRPIMMTSITTIGGLVPLAISGRTEIGISYTSFSYTLIGGMLTATLLTTLVVPVFYTLFDDLRIAAATLVRAFRRAPQVAA